MKPLKLFGLILIAAVAVAATIGSYTTTTSIADNDWFLMHRDPAGANVYRKIEGPALSTALLRDGETYVVAGVLRNTGTGWDVLDGTTHTNLNIVSVANDTTKITVTFSDAVKIISACVQADDAYATNGISFKTGSVTETTVDIVPYVERTLGGYFSYDGAEWDVYGDTSAITFTAGTGATKVWHTADPLWGTEFFGVSANCRAGTYVAGIDDMGVNYFFLKFVDHAGATVTAADTSMKCYWMRRDSGTLDPNDLDLALGNIWLWVLAER